MRAFIVFSAILALAACQHDHHQNLKAEATHLFTLLDEDRDGQFSKQELQITFNKYDENNDKRVTEKEFYVTLCNENPEICPYVVAIFQELDTLNENVLWESNLDSMYKVFDTNGKALFRDVQDRGIPNEYMQMSEESKFPQNQTKLTCKRNVPTF